MAKLKKTKFFVRLLPTEDLDWENIKIEHNREVIHVRCLQDLNEMYKGRKPRFWRFQTDGIFYNACQKDIYDTVVDIGVILSIYEGVNAVILAMGQTCSGKSFTIGGLQNHYEFRGLIPRFISTLFSDIQEKTKEWKVKIGFSFVELLGNSIYDLISSRDVPCEIKNVSVVKILSEEHALNLLFKGEGHRRRTHNAPYIGAHCGSGIVTLHFECISQTRSNAIISRSKVHFVDLAGLETVGKRCWTSFKDTSTQGAANLIKCEIEDAIKNLVKADGYDDGRKPHSKLIAYLGSSFSNGSIIRFIGHIRPTSTDLEVTLSTLKFGQKIKHIPVVPLANYTEPNKDLMHQNIEEELRQLKEQLLVEELLNGTGELKSGNFSQARLAHLGRLASAYLEGWSSEVNVLGNTDTIITLKVFRELFKKKNDEIETVIRENKLSSTQSVIEPETRLSKSSRKSRKSKDEVELPKTQKGAKLSIKEAKKIQVIGVRASVALKQPEQPAVQERELPQEVLPIKQQIDMEPLEQIPVAPNVTDRKIWEDFLTDLNIDSEVLNGLAGSVKKKKIAYESAAAEYTDIKIKLEKNRVALKELAWKRQSGRDDAYDKFGQIRITQEEKSNAKLVGELEISERMAKKLLEGRYNEWKVATTEYLEEDARLNDIFKQYCGEKYHTNMVLQHDVPDDVNIERDEKELSELEKEENARTYYYKLHKRLLIQSAKQKYGVTQNH